MSVSPTTNSANTANTRDAGAAPNVGSGNTADDLLTNFMTLLVAQMQNQDPTNPMDNNQLTSQLAQFQTAAGIEKLNGITAQVGFLVLGSQQMNAIDWVGRTVMIEGDHVVSTSEGGNQDIAFTLDRDVEKVTVTLTDDQGNAYVGTVKDAKPGVNLYTLDDITDFQPTDPREQADTTFTVTYSAITADGDAPDIKALKPSTVESVSFNNGLAMLHLGVDGAKPISDIYHIK
ncbi:flagellar hook assembly protein FlgD [Serratia fonticola]|uniref:flagellar hook assembly protein FlgD n=1 Tax=Serratia fonticola TaxID=47917 RepID=UPI0004656AF0|nr:flagellar hook capping FlgD N-terminal domain-containing protein [Serratia fonticola]